MQFPFSIKYNKRVIMLILSKLLFLQSLRAKNNKSSCEALRLRTKLRGVNSPGLFLSGLLPQSPSVTRSILSDKADFFPSKKSSCATLTIFYLYCCGWHYGEDVQPLSLQRYDNCSALCQREDVQSLLHEVVVLHHVRGKMCSLFFVR